MVVQVHIGGTEAQLSAATEYIAFWGQSNIAAAEAAVPIPAAMTMRALRVDLLVAPGGGTSRTFTILKNGAGTALTVTISGGDTSKLNNSDEVSFAAGDYASLQCTVSGTPAASATVHTVETEFADSTHAVMWHYWPAWSTTSTDYKQMQGGYDNSGSLITAEVQRAIVCPLTGTIIAFYIHLSAEISGGRTLTLRQRVNLADAGGTVAMTGVGVVNGNATGLSQAIAPDDLLAIRANLSSSGNPVPRIGAATLYTPSTANESIISGMTNSAPSGTVTQYNGWLGSRANFTWGSAGALQNLSGPTHWTAGKLYTRVQSAPGAGRSHVYTLRVNGVNTALTATITGGATLVANDTTNSVVIKSGDLLEIEHAPIGTPNATTSTYWSMVQNAQIVPHQPPQGPPKKSLRSRVVVDSIRALLKRDFWQQNRMNTVLDMGLKGRDAEVRLPPIFYDPWRRWGTPTTLLEPIGLTPPVFTPDISRSLQIDTNPSDVPAIDSNPSDAPIIDTNPSDSPSLEA